ncbi:MAG TPA: hypothetical protein VEB19_05355 [Gemmatimonadaceae bacterium]|nr:hypothetical protein [Gemmatimonadaceae bacterium]
MFLNLRVVGSATLALLLVEGRLEAQTACRAADDRSAAMVLALKRLMTSVDTAVVATRLSLSLPTVDQDSVYLIANESVCAQMAAVYGAAISVPRPDNATPSGRVYVAKVGSVYVVMDPAVQKGEWQVKMVINSSGSILARYVS